MRLLVTGGREYSDKRTVYETLDGLARNFTVELVIVGDAPGADTLTARWCQERGQHYAIFPALWKAKGKSAGPRRNTVMLEATKPDFVMAFPGGSGTADLCSKARAKRIKILTPAGDGHAVQ